MRDVVTGAVAVPADRPLVFKSVEMSWHRTSSDLVVAAVVGRGTERRLTAPAGRTARSRQGSDPGDRDDDDVLGTAGKRRVGPGRDEVPGFHLP